MPQAKFSGILFDLDGTLLDTADDLGASLNYLLTKYGLAPVEAAQYRPVASDGAKGLLELGFNSQLTDFGFETLKNEFLSHYEQNSTHKTRLFNQASKLLEELDNAGLPWGIVTNKPEYLTWPLLAHFEQLKSSITTICGDTLPERKPHPAPMLLAAEQMSLAADSLLYIGDAQRDIEAGRRAGMKTAVAAWGYIKSTDRIDDWQADHICHTVTELNRVIF
jgi:phosphoglycolate phosphatase